MAYGEKESARDLEMAHAILSQVYTKPDPMGAILMNIRWQSIAFLLMTGNDCKATAKQLRALADKYDPAVSSEDVNNMLDATLRKK